MVKPIVISPTVQDSSMYADTIQPTRPKIKVIDTVIVSVSIKRVENEYGTYENQITYYFSDKTKNLLQIRVTWKDETGSYGMTRNIPANYLIYDKDEVGHFISTTNSIPFDLQIVSISPLQPTKIQYIFK